MVHIGGTDKHPSALEASQQRNAAITVPVMSYAGAYVALIAWCTAGIAGLRLSGWLATLFWIVAFVSASRHRGTQVGRYWIIGGLGFFGVATLILLATYGISPSFKAWAVETFHIRRVNRSYGAPG